jgi:hypothetical protein
LEDHESDGDTSLEVAQARFPSLVLSANASLSSARLTGIAFTIALEHLLPTGD